MKKLYFVFLIAILLASCGKSEPSNINNGGVGKTNSYESMKKFPNSLYSNYKVTEELGGSATALLELNDGRVLFAGKDGKLACIVGEKTQWICKLDSNAYIYSGMVADAKVNIYFIDYYGILNCLNSDGKRKFSIDTRLISNEIQVKGNLTPTYNDLLIQSDGIIVTGNLVRSAFIAKYSFDGKLIWNYVSTLGVSACPASDSKGNLFINGNSWQDNGTDSLFVLSKDGKLKWSKAFDKQSLIKNPVVNEDRVCVATSLYLGESKVSKLFSYKLDGSIVYEKEYSFVVRNLSLSQSNSIYLVCYNASLGGTKSGIFAIKPNGDKDWNIYIDYSIPTPCLISKEEIAVAGTNRSSMGIFYLDRITGKLIMVQDIGRADELTYKPFVNKTGNIIMPSLETSSYMKVDYTLIDKLYNF